jgi:hypothetical protein
MSPETEALLKEVECGHVKMVDEIGARWCYNCGNAWPCPPMRLATALRAAEARADANAKDAERWRLELAQLVGSDDPKELKGMALMMGAFADSQPEAHRAVQALLTYHRARAQEVDRG